VDGAGIKGTGMIQEFSIENTYSIKTRQTISFEAAEDTDDIHCIDADGKKLLKLAAIYGANASGKSNIIRAFNAYIQFILFAFSYLKPRDATKFVPFLFDRDLNKRPGTFEIIFYVDQIRYEYLLMMDSRCIHKECLNYSPRGKKKLLFERICLNPADEWEKLNYKWRWGDSYSGEKNKLVRITRSNVSFLNTAAQLKHPLMEQIYNYFHGIHMPVIKPVDQGLRVYTGEKIENNKKIKHDILNFLSKIDIGVINDITIEDQELPDFVVEKYPDEEKPPRNSNGKYVVKEIRFSHQYAEKFTLSLFEESNGTQRIFELAGPLFEILNNNKFLCIDEIEMSLHEELLEYFLKMFLKNSTGSQIMFTTHNQDLLDSDILRNDEIWFVEKDKTGGSELFSLVEFKNVPEDVSRRKLYKAGGFGAMPLILHHGGKT
jgi:AAA15 family ATPase/GTPase